MIEALADRRYNDRPVVTYLFLGLCLAVTLAVLLRPSLHDLLGGIAPRRHAWQPFTAVFMHGWPGVPGPLHLGLNAILILAAGIPTERLLGSGRFLALCLAAAAASAAAVHLTEGVNGSSLVIWSWGPSLYLALRASRAADPSAAEGPTYRRVRGVLVVMYVVVTLGMAGIPYLHGWRGNPVAALALGNRYHLVATAVGVVLGLAWRGHIHRRLARVAERHLLVDTLETEGRRLSAEHQAQP